MHESLKHVANASHHADALADEAEDLGAENLAARLRALGDHVVEALEDALNTADAVEPARDARHFAHDQLTCAYDDATRRLRSALGAKACATLTPGGILDVAERLRFRLRALEFEDAPGAVRIREALRCALDRYEAAVDVYLSTAANALLRRQQAVYAGQVARRKLEQAKAHLLTRATPGSDSYKRIKRRAVRTRPPAWFVEEADTEKNRIVITITEEAKAGLSREHPPCS